MSINDTVQYDYKIYTTQEGLDAVNEPGRDGLDNYNFAMPLHTLLTPEAESKRLIEFGSLYGSFRINLKGADPRWSKLLLKIQGAMMFKTDLLNSISRQMASLMGGNENFIGLHLRVGDGAFKVHFPDTHFCLLVIDTSPAGQGRGADAPCASSSPEESLPLQGI